MAEQTLKEYKADKATYMRAYRQKNLEKLRAYNRAKQKEYRLRKKYDQHKGDN